MKLTVKQAAEYHDILAKELQFLPSRPGTDNRWAYAVDKNLDKISSSLKKEFSELQGIINDGDINLLNSYQRLYEKDRLAAENFKRDNSEAFKRIDKYQKKEADIMSREVDIQFHTIIPQHLCDVLNAHQLRMTRQFMVSEVGLIK